MGDRQRLRIESNGTGPGTHLTLDGQPLPAVTGITWHVGEHEIATAEIEVQVVEAVTLAGEITWAGLELVPTDALEAELARRHDDRKGDAHA